ncbi:MAG: hypothetical protein IT366_06800 [Candidatus Hydrogenedentes bacterium]|nr:hypothetical protein [Candidatus Hydrogenedentota bacterium]
MTAQSSPTPMEFEETFRDAIRVGFNWDRFLSEEWPIERVVLNSDDDLARCFTPWYVGKCAEELSYDHPHAVPMSLSDVPEAFSILSDGRKVDVQEKIDEFRGGPSPVRFTVPTYALPDDRYFVLDKNHRLSALAVSGMPFEVELWNVRGPFEKDCLLDLDFWLKDKGDDSADL